MSLRLNRIFAIVVAVASITVWTLSGSTNAEDWLRFRGPAGSGVSTSKVATPVSWSNESNMLWKLELPGPGHSCPIVVGDKVFVTCWSGYGTDRGNPGDQKNLKRHLVCVNRADGKIVWDKAVPAVLPEDNYSSMFAEHGYSTHTPVSDGEHVFVFYGKSGVVAYDMEGKEIWKKSVGTDLNRQRWGSSSSPILYKDKVIVSAGMESGAILALDKKTGDEVWKTPAGSYLGSTWGTPLIAKTDSGREDLVMLVPGEVWGMNPDNGKLRWYVEMQEERSACASAIQNDGKVFAMGERSGIVAFKPGGAKGDPVAESDILWKAGERGRIPTPIQVGNRMYIVNGGAVTCINTDTGEKVYAERLKAPKAAPSDSADAPAEQGGRGRGGYGGRRGGGGSDYSSPIVADGKMYYVSRSGVAYVIKLGDTFEQLATNTFTDGGDFSASPAAADGQLFFRSSKNLYCIAEQKSEK